MEKSVKLIENFCSYQGEGPDSGRAMIILRFKTCNRKCPWCDTAVKMRISAEAPYQLSDIQDTIYKTRSGLLITGGEPTVARHINEAALLLNELDYPIANVETNGYDLLGLYSKVSLRKNVHFIYSPKIFNSNDLEVAIELTEEILVHNNIYIKVVYEDEVLVRNYLDFLTSVINKHKSHKVWLMPEGINRPDLIKNSEIVFDACEKYKFNFSSRNHIIFGFV